jgi:hypothetical protein
MIYCELALDGQVKIYDMTDRLLLLIVSLESNARALPVPTTINEAVEYIKTRCYQFECFDTLIDFENWLEYYKGFREGEVRKEYARLIERLDATHPNFRAA